MICNFLCVCVREREKITVSYLIDVKTANHFPVSTLQFWQDESVGTGSGRGLSMQMDFRHIPGVVTQITQKKTLIVFGV